MKILLTTINCSYKHKALGIRWLYVANLDKDLTIKEFTLKSDYNSMLDFYVSNEFDVIVFSTYVYNVDIIRRLICDINNIDPNIRLLIGGPEISYDDDYLEIGCEAIMVGEGEQQLNEYLKTGRADGVKTRDWVSPVKRAVSDISYLETLESPYFLDFDKSMMDKQYFYLETSRGCPYKCSYCFSANDNKVRFFSSEYLANVFGKIKEHNIDQVKILDRTFNCGDDHSLMILKLVEENTNVNSFQMELVADNLSNNIMNYFLNIATVNKYRFEVGIQSFNEKTLSSINRSCNIEKLIKNVCLLTGKGYIIHGDLIAGLPYENLASFKDSFDKLYCLNLAEIQVGILKVLPETPIKNNIDEYDMKYLVKSPHTIVSNKWVSSNDISIIEFVYNGVEKNYNNQRLFYSLPKLLLFSQLRPFDLFASLGSIIDEIAAPYTLKDYFLCVYAYFDFPEIKYYLSLDYYLKFNHKVSKLFDFNITKKKRNALKKKMISAGTLTDIQFEKYTTIIENDELYSIIFYRVDRSKPQLINVRKANNEKNICS